MSTVVLEKSLKRSLKVLEFYSHRRGCTLIMTIESVQLDELHMIEIYTGLMPLRKYLSDIELSSDS